MRGIGGFMHHRANFAASGYPPSGSWNRGAAAHDIVFSIFGPSCKKPCTTPPVLNWVASISPRVLTGIHISRVRDQKAHASVQIYPIINSGTLSPILNRWVLNPVTFRTLYSLGGRRHTRLFSWDRFDVTISPSAGCDAICRFYRMSAITQ